MYYGEFENRELGIKRVCRIPCIPHICHIVCLPSIWKLADVTPLPKRKPIKEIKKDLRPISLTPCISKLAEDFVVTLLYVKPAVLYMLDPSQFGAIPKSSTTLALLEMLHEWTQGTDGNGATIRPCHTAAILSRETKKALFYHKILVLSTELIM